MDRWGGRLDWLEEGRGGAREATNLLSQSKQLFLPFTSTSISSVSGDSALAGFASPHLLQAMPARCS